MKQVGDINSSSLFQQLKPVRIAGIDSMLCKRPLGELLLQNNLQSSDPSMLTSNSIEPCKPSLICDPRTKPTEPCNVSHTCISGTNTTQLGRGRGRGRGRKSQEVKHSKTQVQGAVTNEGRSLNIESIHGLHCVNRKNICEIKRENESKRTICNERTGTLDVNKKEDDFPVQSESWEDELFADKDTKKL